MLSDSDSDLIRATEMVSTDDVHGLCDLAVDEVLRQHVAIRQPALMPWHVCESELQGIDDIFARDLFSR